MVVVLISMHITLFCKLQNVSILDDTWKNLFHDASGELQKERIMGSWTQFKKLYRDSSRI